MDLNFKMNAILAIGLMVVIGLLGGFTARKIKFPTISGYIIVGIIISLLNIIPGEIVDSELNIITDIKFGGYWLSGRRGSIS